MPLEDSLCQLWSRHSLFEVPQRDKPGARRVLPAGLPLPLPVPVSLVRPGPATNSGLSSPLALLPKVERLFFFKKIVQTRSTAVFSDTYLSFGNRSANAKVRTPYYCTY